MQLWRSDRGPAAGEVAELARLLTGGGVALLPTDTIYGLHAAARDHAACARIADLKGREDTKPFLVLAAGRAQLHRIGAKIPSRYAAALDSLWPAPLTAIVPLEAPIAASRGASTIGVRIPSIEWLRQLAAEAGPIASTSANRSGEPAIQTPEELPLEMLERLDAVVDVGRLEGKPSVIVDLTGEDPRLIREGESPFTQFVWKTLRNSL